MFCEPLSGFRQATAREHRTKTDWAIEVAQLLDTRYADRRIGELSTLQSEIAIWADKTNAKQRGSTAIQDRTRPAEIEAVVPQD
jgi:hypothetical protein